MNVSKAKTWSVHNKLELVSVVLAFLVCLLSIIAMIGYWMGTDLLYRPVANGPATNPLTAMSALMGGLYILMDMSKYTDHPFKPLFLLVVFSAALLRIMDFLTGSHITEELSPFYYDVMSDMNYGKSNSMGLNTGLMFLVFSLALVSKGLKKYLLSQILSTIAFVIPTVAVLGYPFELDKLYGQMSLLTAVLGILLALSVLASTSGRDSVRPVHDPR